MLQNNLLELFYNEKTLKKIFFTFLNVNQGPSDQIEIFESQKLWKGLHIDLSEKWDIKWKQQQNNPLIITNAISIENWQELLKQYSLSENIDYLILTDKFVFIKNFPFDQIRFGLIRIQYNHDSKDEIQNILKEHTYHLLAQNEFEDWWIDVHSIQKLVRVIFPDQVFTGQEFFQNIKEYMEEYKKTIHVQDITYDWLVELGDQTQYTSHIQHFKTLFDLCGEKISHFLEFGVGYSTKYFLDRCDHVTSVEFITPGAGGPWLEKTCDLYKHNNSWTPIAYFSEMAQMATNWRKTKKYLGNPSIYQAAAYQAAHHQDYSLQDLSFLHDLENFFQEINRSEKKIEVGFVDCEAGLRGNLVNLLFHFVPIVVAHDIDSESNRKTTANCYGYNRIKKPSNFTEIFMENGSTAFWIRNDIEKYKNLIENWPKRKS